MDKKMKIKLLTLLPFILEVIALFFLPQEIPIHYNSSFQVDGYGSKYNVLILGVIVIVFGSFMNWIYTTNVKTEHEAIIYRLCVVALMVFNVINVLFLYVSMTAGMSVAIIGGADGPTSVFIAGPVGAGIPFVLLLGILVVLFSIIVLRFKKEKR